MTNPAARPTVSCELTRFEAEHLESAVALSQATGWAHRAEDWAMLLSLSHGLVAIHAGRVVGTALRADFGHGISTVSMVIVDAALRGQGLGRRITTAVIGDAPGALRLVATASGKPLYETLGFETVGRVATVRGIARAAGALPGIRHARAEDLPRIAELESESFGGDRSALVAWFRTNASLAVSGRSGAIRGFAASRRFGNGHVIGPVVAQSAGEALALVAHLADALQGQSVRLDVSEGSGLLPGLEQIGLRAGCPAPVMQRGTVSATSARHALVSQALA